MSRLALTLLLSCLLSASGQGQDRDQRIADLQRQLTEAKARIATLQKTIESLSTEMRALRQPDHISSADEASVPRENQASEERADPSADFSKRIIGAENGSDEHDNEFKAKPEIFIDPVTGLNIQAFNFGYFRPIGQFSRLSFDYQFKNHPSFEDDAINGRFQITWGIVLK